MTETERQKLNQERLVLVDVSIRSQVAAVLATMETKGLRPLIAKDVFRSPARQRQLYNEGRTKVTWGFHNATVPGTKPPRPGSLAADIVDADVDWKAPQSFWLELGAATIREGLGWGGFFSLPTKLRVRLKQVLYQPELWNQKIQFGFDPAHVEVLGITISQARAGKR